MEGNPDFTEIVVGEEVMEQADGAVSPLANIHSLVNEVIDLWDIIKLDNHAHSLIRSCS